MDERLVTSHSLPFIHVQAKGASTTQVVRRAQDTIIDRLTDLAAPVRFSKVRVFLPNLNQRLEWKRRYYRSIMMTS